MRNKGFTLIELMIVVAIILIIAAIAVPNLLQSRIRANEADVIQQLRNYVVAQEKFRDVGASAIEANNASAKGATGWFADNHRNLYYGIADADSTANIRLVNKDYADAFLAASAADATPTVTTGPEAAPAAPKAFSGYFFTEPKDAPAGFFEQHFAQLAIPENSGKTGNHAFFVDDNGAIRSFALPSGRSADETMASLGDRTPLTDSGEWETIR